MSIPDKAVEAAREVLFDDGHNALDCRPERGLDDTVRAMLEAAEPYLTPSVDRDAAVERLMLRVREAEARDRSALDQAGWVGSVMPGVPEDKLRDHCIATVDLILAPEVES